ncbi:MAG: protein translocase subunit SecD [Clostridia bacterium]|nr:protein translocase subunit SecD [Clostridia bacterium]
MSNNAKKILAVLLALVIVFGWYLTIFGMGSFEPVKDKIKMGLDIKGGVYVVMEAQTDAVGEELDKLMEQTQAVIEERVNQMGLSEPVVTIEGTKRIRVELPGAEDAEAAIDQIGKTAQLQFAMADGTVVLDGSNIKDAGVGQDQQHGGYAVTLEFDSEGADKFAEATKKALSGTIVPSSDELRPNTIMIILDGKPISTPGVSEVIASGRCEITSGGTGGFPQEEATNLAALIRGGALPVSLEEVQTSNQTATIGVDALEKSVIAGLIGLALIFVIMLVAYGIMGVAADIALLLYVIIVLWAMAAMGSVLTLPGIAGIILSVGMAVDANVIIFTRIREEIAMGKSVRVSVQMGFKRAMSTVIDSQITTIIAAVVLYQIGSSTVKGFAMTLMIGIIASIFTAVVVTQVYLSIMSESRTFGKKSLYGMKEDNTPKFQLKKQFRIIKNRKIFYCISIAIILIGLVIGGVRGMNYGIDFTGGTMMQIDMGQHVDTDDVQDVLDEFDIDAQIIYSGEKNEQVIIRTITSLDNDARAEIINALQAQFGFDDKDVLSVEQFGPSVGKELQGNAVKAILIAAVGMLIYIIIRFEWKFGIAAVIGVFHDVLILIAFYAIFRVTVNNPFIAGVLTVVGYSINDTIVIFDRIRENLGLMKKSHTDTLIEASVNQTLSRSIMTSFTTLVVMIPLFVMTSNTIREFTLPLMVGVIAGTVSSVTLCSPLYYEFCNMLGGPKYKAGKKSKKNAKNSVKAEKELQTPEAETESVPAENEEASSAETNAPQNEEKKYTSKASKKSGRKHK